MKASFVFVLLISTTLVMPGLARGQEGLVVKLMPRAGLLAPDQYFYEVFTSFAEDDPVEWTTGSLGRAFVAGIGVEVGFGNDGIMLRGEILRSFDAWLLAVHNVVRPRVLFEPPRIITTYLDVPVTITFTSLQAVLPLELEFWRIEPYVLLGVGGKRYGFGEPTLPNDVEAILPSAGFVWGGDLGGGFGFEAFGLKADVQVRDAISRYWDKTQHDLLFTGALSWRVR